MARAWFFLMLLNSSSFSATRLSISCLTLASSSWARSTLFSSISRVGAASLTELIQEILDLVSEVLVLPLNNVQLLGGLLLGGLQAEQLGAVVAALVLGAH